MVNPPASDGVDFHSLMDLVLATDPHLASPIKSVEAAREFRFRACARRFARRKERSSPQRVQPKRREFALLPMP
jgi:hypothetical protein